MTSEEFFRLTPRQFHLLLARYKEQRKYSTDHAELLTGILAATFANFTANWSMGPPKEPMSLSPADFMPSQLKKKKKVKAGGDLLTQQMSAFFDAQKIAGKVVDEHGNKIGFRPGGQPKPGGKGLV